MPNQDNSNANSNGIVRDYDIGNGIDQCQKCGISVITKKKYDFGEFYDEKLQKRVMLCRKCFLDSYGFKILKRT